MIVHGGGPAISRALERFGIETEFVGGLRKTTQEVLDIVEMVLSGQINKEVVRRILAAGGDAVGLSGVDGRLLEAEKARIGSRYRLCGGRERRTYGADSERLLQDGLIPAIAPIGIGAGRSALQYQRRHSGRRGRVCALGVTRLLVVTDVPGILRSDGEGQR